MTLTQIRTLVRKDLHDEDAAHYRWTDDELNRHIAHAVSDFSEALPLEQKATLATTSGSREVSLTGLTNRVMIESVEYPVGQFPPRYQRFAVWGDILTLLGPEIPDGSNCIVYYGQLHTLDESGSTIADQHLDLLVTGACGYAAEQKAGCCINQINTGGIDVPADWASWAQRKLDFFRIGLKYQGRRNRVRARQLYSPYLPLRFKTTDWGP